MASFPWLSVMFLKVWICYGQIIKFGYWDLYELALMEMSVSSIKKDQDIFP